MLEKCNVHLKYARSRVCECNWNMDGRVSTVGASYCTLFSIMAHECTDVTNIEGLTICCSSCVVNGGPEEHLIEILTLKKANAESIYSVEYYREINIP